MLRSCSAWHFISKHMYGKICVSNTIKVIKYKYSMDLLFWCQCVLSNLTNRQTSTYVHHQRDGLHLNGRGGLKASCSDVLNYPQIQLIFLLKLFERAERVWDVSAMHVNPVLMPDLIELKHSDKTSVSVSNTEVALKRLLLTRKSQHTDRKKNREVPC